VKANLRFLVVLSLLLTAVVTKAERLVLVSASYGKNVIAITDRDGGVLWSHKTAGPQQGHAGHLFCIATNF